MKKRVISALLALCLLGTLSACGQSQRDRAGQGTDGASIEQARALIDHPVEELYEAIGQPNDQKYASSCLGEGEDGELYYDGFTVYTYRETEETIYDVMETLD